MREPVPGTFGTLGSFPSNLVHFEIGTKYKIGTGTKNRTITLKISKNPGSWYSYRFCIDFVYQSKNQDCYKVLGTNIFFPFSTKKWSLRVKASLIIKQG